MQTQDDGADSVRRSLEHALAGQYVLLRLLGRGGMGAVYLARDVALERLVAVKVLPVERGADPASRERFRREARTAARLMHPNIVPLHGFGEADGMPYLVMGYVQGEPLSARMRRGTRCSPAEARRLGAELADALDHAHSKGVVHRDVKPDNVLIDDETGRALLADFGVAKARGGGPSVTQTGGVVGTPAFMSPEQAAGREDLDGRSDLYSLGALLYALLAGRLPFEGRDAGELLAKHLTQEPKALAELRPGVPDDLAATVMRCLAKDRERRWPDARRLREALSPTGLDEEQLPEPLDALDGFAPTLLPFAVVWLLATWHWLVSSRSGAEAGVLAPVLTLVLGGVFVYRIPWLVSALRLARRRGFAWATILGSVVRQPEWWPLWYPRRFRRPGDVWDRLPLSFRISRAVITLLVAVLIASTLLWMLVRRRIELALAAQRDPGPAIGPWLPLAVWLVVVLTIVLVAALALGARYVLAMGLDVYTRRKLASALLWRPTARRALWKRPEIARALLPPATAGLPLAEPTSPREYASAIARLTGARDEAQALVAEMEALDLEIERLARDADPEEAERLRIKLEDLGPESAADGEERRQMRRLLAQQLELISQLVGRVEDARASRKERFEALRRLWRQASLSSEDAESETRTAGT